MKTAAGTLTCNAADFTLIAKIQGRQWLKNQCYWEISYILCCLSTCLPFISKHTFHLSIVDADLNIIRFGAPLIQFHKSGRPLIFLVYTLILMYSHGKNLRGKIRWTRRPQPRLRSTYPSSWKSSVHVITDNVYKMWRCATVGEHNFIYLEAAVPGSHQGRL